MSLSLATPLAKPSLRLRIPAAIVRFDGLFLLIVGAWAMTLEAVGHFIGAGPLAHLANSPYTIGGFEAHGLAAIIGWLLWRGASGLALKPWHRCAMLVHALLGASNLAFWGSFVAFDAVAVGVATTIVHVLFVIAHACCVVQAAARK